MSIALFFWGWVGVSLGATLRVPEDHATLAAALAAATDGDEILVGPGTYKESSLSYGSKELDLRSTDGHAATVIDCEQNGPAFYIYGGAGKRGSLDGFTITNGRNEHGGALVTGSSYVEIRNCRFADNTALDEGGVWFQDSGGSPWFRDCTFENNQSLGQGGVGYLDGGTGVFESCVFNGNGAGTGHGSVLMVSFGTSVILKGCLIEDNAGVTVLNASGGFELGLDGCEIQFNGGDALLLPDRAVVRDSDISNNAGQGIYVLGGDRDEQHVLRTIVSHNATEYDGGGVRVRGMNTLFEDCVISSNSAGRNGGGVFCTVDSDPTFVRTTFSGNSAYAGGGVYCGDRTTAAFVRCLISENSAKLGAGAMCDVSETSSPRFEACEIVGNEAASGGGLLLQNSFAECSNTVIADNLGSSAGGGVWVLQSEPLLTNVTIVNNESPLGAGIYSALSAPPVYGSILWNNQPDELLGQAAITYSDVRGGHRGIGNINADPRFEDSLGDYRIRGNSPCVDTGSGGRGRDGCVPPGVGSSSADMGAYGGEENCSWECDLRTLVGENPATVRRGESLRFTASAVNSCAEPRTIDEAVLQVSGGSVDVELSLYNGGAIQIQPGAQVSTTVKLGVPGTILQRFYRVRLITRRAGVEVDEDRFLISVR